MPHVESRPPHQEKPTEQTIDRFLGFCRSFTGERFGVSVKHKLADHDFDEIEVLVSDPKQKFEMGTQIGSVKFISRQDSFFVSTSYSVYQGKKGRHVVYEDISWLKLDSKSSALESMTWKQKREFRKKHGKFIKKSSQEFEKDIESVTEWEFSSKVDELETLAKRYNL